MKTNYTLPLTLASAALFSACLFEGKDESKASARFEFNASASTALAKSSAAGDLVIGDTTGIRITLNEALLNIKKIHLGEDSDDDTCGKDSAKEDCVDKSDKSVKEGPFIVNLLTGATTPEIGTMTFPAGTYNRVKIHIHQPDGKDTSPMNDQTFLAKGTYSNKGGVEKPFTLSLKFNEVIHIRSAAGMILDGDAVHTILVGLNAGVWLSNLDLKGCLSTLDVTAGGAMVISEDSQFGKCLDAEHVLKGNFRGSFKIKKK